MARQLEGKVESNENEITLYDSAADVTVICDLTEVTYVEWDGYPERNWNDANWFMVEVAGDDFSYFVDTADMDERTRNAILDRSEGVATGAVDQEGSEIFRSEN